MNKRFIGRFEDLQEKKSESYNGKFRYFCPYCDSIHGKSKDDEGCVIFNMNTMSGYCFRCETLITHDGLMSEEYIQSKLSGKIETAESDKAKTDKINIDWLTSANNNKVVMDYLKGRNITQKSIDRFNLLACSSPFNGVAFYNKLIDDKHTDYLYLRGIDSKSNHKHTFIKDVVKKPSWLDKVNTNEVVLCEGFFDGLAVYQHGLELPTQLCPVILSGKIVTNYQLSEIKSTLVKQNQVNITVCMDGGFFEDTLKIADKLYQGCYNSKIYVMILPYGKDPNEVSKEMFLKSFKYRLEYEPSKKQYIRDRVYNR